MSAGLPSLASSENINSQPFFPLQVRRASAWTSGALCVSTEWWGHLSKGPRKPGDSWAVTTDYRFFLSDIKAVVELVSWAEVQLDHLQTDPWFPYLWGSGFGSSAVFPMCSAHIQYSSTNNLYFKTTALSFGAGKNKKRKSIFLLDFKCDFSKRCCTVKKKNTQKTLPSLVSWFS